jgi:hypothetical protein
MTDTTPIPPTVSMVMRKLIEHGWGATYLGPAPQIRDEDRVFDDAHAEHRQPPAHEMPAHPSRGFHPQVWGFLLEMLAQSGTPILVQHRRWLLPADAQVFAKKSVWPVSMIEEAFAFVLRQKLVDVYATMDGAEVAVVNIDALARHLREQLELEKWGQSRALQYFRGRQMHARLPWIDAVLQLVDEGVSS